MEKLTQLFEDIVKLWGAYGGWSGQYMVGIRRTLLLAVAATMETQIRLEERTKKGSRFSFRDYMQDFKDGFAYLKKEKGLLRIYSYMPVTQGLAEATDPLIRADHRRAGTLQM